MSDFTCGAHRSFIYLQGGQTLVAELTPLSAVRWQRIRDEVSTAEAVVPTTECCELLSDLRCIEHELRIERNGAVVWQGPIIRIEYEWDTVRIFAEDIMWMTKRTAVKTGYSNAYPNIGVTLDDMDRELHDAFNAHGNPWRATLLPMYNPVAGTDPKTSKSVYKYQQYIYDDVDKMAEDGGVDYVVINRTIYYNDTHLARFTLPDLQEEWISTFPKIVEYGNQLATQAVVTDGYGRGVVVPGGGEFITQYGYIEWLTSLVDDEQEAKPDPPTPDELLAWQSIATRSISNRAPSPVAVLIPANSTLMPGAAWTIDQLIPTAWFKCKVTRMCRTVDQWQKLDEVVVNENADEGETVQISASSAPGDRINPTP